MTTLTVTSFFEDVQLYRLACQFSLKAPKHWSYCWKTGIFTSLSKMFLVVYLLIPKDVLSVVAAFRGRVWPSFQNVETRGLLCSFLSQLPQSGKVLIKVNRLFFPPQDYRVTPCLCWHNAGTIDKTDCLMGFSESLWSIKSKPTQEFQSENNWLDRL